MTSAAEGNLLVPAALFGWIPLVIALFAFLPPRRAVIIGFVAAWLLLPVAEYEFMSLPEYNKVSASCLGIFFGALIFDTNTLLKFRPKWYDLPVFVLCFCPVMSSLTNGLGLYDGFSESLKEIFLWMLPYLIGRLYFTDLKAIRELVIGIFVGGLLYAPLCLWEIRMTPQLHRQVYGFAATSFIQTFRYGGFRPVVFIGGSGLTLGLWMAFSAISGHGLMTWKSLKHLYGIPMLFFVCFLFGTSVLGKSTAAVLLMVMGMGVLTCVWYMRNSLPVIGLALAPTLFIVIRVLGLWDGAELVNVASEVFGSDRAQSLDYRFYNERLLREHAWQNPLFGWGGWGRSRLRDEHGNDLAVTDSLWIIKFGANGLLGLGAFIAMLTLPVYLLHWRIPKGMWNHPLAGPTILTAVLLGLGLVNNCLNAGVIPMSILLAGGLTGLKIAAPEPAAPPLRPRSPREPVTPAQMVYMRRQSLKPRRPDPQEPPPSQGA